MQVAAFCGSTHVTRVLLEASIAAGHLLLKPRPNLNLGRI